MTGAGADADTEEQALVERAARAIIRCAESDGPYRGTSAEKIIDEAAGEDLDEWCRLARKAQRRAREIREETIREGIPPRKRITSSIEPVYSPGAARTQPRKPY